MPNRSSLSALVILLAVSAGPLAQPAQQFSLEHCDQFEVVRQGEQYITYATGNTKFNTRSGFIYCDSAIWRRGLSVRLKGHVFIDDEEYLLKADSVYYDLVTKDAVARGEHVELWSYDDSLYAVGTHAFYSEGRDYFYMEERPTARFNYPDSSTMVTVVADYIEFGARPDLAEAIGNVEITSEEMSTQSGCALLNTKTNALDLFDNPKARKGRSEIDGELISVSFDNHMVERIDVIDSARAEFVEPTDSTETWFDRSVLSGKRIIFDFEHGLLSSILCYGQAYSWYYPASREQDSYNQNSASGDTIRFSIENEKLKRVNIVGGAIGSYTTGDIIEGELHPVDTVDYSGQYITYDMDNSFITLRNSAHVQSGSMALDAHLVLFDTRQDLIEAFSASVDTLGGDIGDELASEHIAQYQPNAIPVVLHDGDDNLFGDYLLYSTATEKGRIVKSKSDFQDGLYYGDRLYREQKDIFYVCNGRYTTCDAEDPHFHFHSSNMKLIEGEKLLARPVVFYIERIPLFILPFYVFPLERGRHSGFLPFTFGKFQKGDRYVRNVGYYWAASEYWDWLGSFDYFEQNRHLTFNSRVSFKKRYVLDAYISGSYLRQTSYDDFTATESKRNRWVINSAYNHTIVPSFNIRASGRFLSDKQYYSDYSLNTEERLNRSIKSQVSFSKRFGKSTSLSGNFTHTVNLDQETRIDDLPTMTLSLPTIWPFGNGKIDEDGKLQQSWYNRITFRYSPAFRNFSSRNTLDSAITGSPTNDSVSYRSRKKYARISHNPSLNLPAVRLGHYANLVPRFSYSETWFKIFETDQSFNAGIDADETYRTYSYRASIAANTKLYGMIYPDLFGLVGLRQVINPSITYSYSPEIDRHPEVRSFAGGGAGSAKSSSINVSLNHSYQAKIRRRDDETNLELLSVTSSFGYNFEEEDRPFSGLNTTYQSGIGRVKFYGRLQHSFYRAGSNDLHFWSPFLQSFTFNTRFSIAGTNFLFDESAQQVLLAADTSSLPSPVAPGGRAGSGWNLSATYSYSESGRDDLFRKRSFLNLSLRFSLTPTTSVSYTQYYDIDQQLTVRNSVNIVKQIHCWSGSLYWVPIGSNRGFGFKLFVSAIPEIKFDNKHDSFLDSVSR